MSENVDDYFCSSATKWFVLRKKFNRKYHIHPINAQRSQLGEFHHLYKQLRDFPDRFYEYVRMEPATFYYILDKIKIKLVKRWKNCHKTPICAEEKLVITLRYLATGTSFRSLAFSFRMGFSTIASIVKSTVEVLWTELQPLHMPVPTEELFSKNAQKFYETWNFPNCIGAIDGKHIRINCPIHSGTMYYNYKQFFSFILLAVVDADYKFSVIDVGGYGKQSDGGIFRSSALFTLMERNQLHIPADNNLPFTEIKMPYVFIADEAFPLLDHLMKPYGKNQLNLETEYFNKRLSRARKTVECAFGIIYSKWRILSKSIETSEKTADNIVKAICVLHNTVIDRESFERHLQGTVEISSRANLQHRQTGRPADSSKFIRDTFKSYVCKNRIQFVE